MNKALFAALASVALLGASCSVQEFAPVVLDKPIITASLPVSYEGAITTNTITKYYGKYSFRYGYLSENRFDFDTYIVTSTYNDNSYVVRDYLLKPNTTYSFSMVSLKSNGEVGVWLLQPNYALGINDSGYRGLTSNYDPSATFTTNSTGKIKIGVYENGDFSYLANNLCIVEGSTSLPFQPYAYGFSFDTPVTGAGSCAMDMYYNNGDFMPRNSYLAYNYNDECKVYTDGIHFDFGGNDDLLAEFRAKFLGAFASGRSYGFDWDEDYDDTELVFVPVIDDYNALTYCEFYIEDRYQAGYEDGYYAAELDNGIFNHAYYVSGSDGTNTVTNYIDDSLLEWYSSANTQGLFDPYSLVSFLGLASDATTYTITIQYGEVYASANFPIAAYPLYVDVLADGVVEDTSLCPYLSISTYRGGSIRGNTLFAADFTNSYAGLAVGYLNYGVYNREYDSFNRISLVLPKNQSYADMRQIGVVSPYARGYVDGVNSRDGEVDDLTDRILALQNDLSQYQGKTYEQIYNLGLQAGLDENAQGAATFNSLFGNILTAPLTILNGLTDISFFGMPILTAILSLLMVAMALFLFKRFK